MSQTVAPKMPLTPRPQPARAAATPFEPLPVQKRAFAEALARTTAKAGKQEPRAETGVLAAVLPREFANLPIAGPASSAGDVDPALHAHLDRIAAAIAEVAKTGAPEVQLSLPLGAYRIDGAVLGRDATGNVNILLMSSTAVPPTVAAQWSEQLGERLQRRDVRVGKIGVQATKARAVPLA